MPSRVVGCAMTGNARRLGQLLAKMKAAPCGGAVRHKSHIWPTVPFLDKESLLFSKKSILKNYELIPLILIVGIGGVCEALYLIRLALTRDDVRFCRRCQMACEYVEMDRPKRPPIRKFRVYKQKYETPPCLIKALRDPTQAELDEMEQRRRKKNQRPGFWEWLKSLFFRRRKQTNDMSEADAKCQPHNRE